MCSIIVLSDPSPTLIEKKKNKTVLHAQSRRLELVIFERPKRSFQDLPVWMQAAVMIEAQEHLGCGS